MRDFGMRVLFQMSSADSSEMMDSSAANLLGIHNALLSVESEGYVEKFRPYGLPSEEWLRRIQRQLAGESSLEDATDLDDFHIL